VIVLDEDENTHLFGCSSSSIQASLWDTEAYYGRCLFSDQR
jgi:hypothetical protein